MNSDQLRKLIDVVSESSQGVAEGSSNRLVPGKFYLLTYNNEVFPDPGAPEVPFEFDDAKEVLDFYKYRLSMYQYDDFTPVKFDGKNFQKIEGVAEESSDNKYSNLSNRGVNRGINRAADDFDRMMDLDQAESPHYKTQHQQDTKQRLKTKPMPGPKGPLPEEQGMEESDLSGPTLHWSSKLKDREDPEGKRTKLEPATGKYRVTSAGPEGAKYVKQQIKSRQQSGGIAGPKGQLPKQGVAEGKRTLRDYIAESETAYSRPVRGDNFAINIREECLLETWVCDETVDGIVLHADNRMIEMLHQYGYLQEGDISQLQKSIADAPVAAVAAMETGHDVADAGEYDFEGDMAKDDLATIIRAARRLTGMLDDNENMPEWVQSKINKAADYVDTAADYVESNKEQDMAEGLDPIKKIRLNDLIELYRDSTEPNAYYDREIDDPDEVIAMIRSEFGNKIADQVAAGAKKMHYPRHGIQRSDPLGGNRPVDRMTKAGKMYKQDMDFRKRMSKYRMGIDEQGVAEGFNSDLEMQLHNLTKSPDMYDAIYNALGRNDSVGQHLQDMMSDVARENRLHPDDDIEQIIDVMADRLEDQYGDPDISEAKYQGRTVPLGKPMKGDVKKSKVYVRGPKGNVVKVNFGQKGMKIKKSIPGRRKNFRARHNCDNPGPRWKARYWSCRAW